MPIFVIGHRNPDSDAVCSAIGYAHYLQQTGRDAEPACCGQVNARTQFALDQAGIPLPRLIMDVRPTAGQLCRKEFIKAESGESLFQVFNRMRSGNLRSVPVIDAGERFLGVLSLNKMLGFLLPETGGPEARHVRSNLDLILDAVGGTYQNAVETAAESDFMVTVGAMSASTFSDRLTSFPAEKVLMVTGNRPTIQKPAIDYGVRCLIITGGYQLQEDLLARAIEKGVTVICSPHDTASTTVLMKSARFVTDALLDDPLHFDATEVLDGVRDRVLHSNQALFPVLESADKLLGVFSKSDLIQPPLTELVLVDHNEYNQAVSGVEYARILEVIDHHRVGGGLSTRDPIRFINEPLGSTSTIVARMFRDHQVPLDPGVALCLATGMIADTLMLSSPTTTDVDREVFTWLEQKAGRDLKEFADQFFATGSVLKIQSADEAVRGDCKLYQEGDWKLAVAQIEELGLERFWERKDELIDALERMRKEEGQDFACLLVTDIGHHYSVLLVRGEESLGRAIDYPRLQPNIFELDGIVSRKKQLLPHLTQIFSRIPKLGKMAAA